MLRFLHKQAVQHVRRLLLSGEGCITRRCRPKQRQRVKCRRLVIIGIATRQILHGLLVSEGARAGIDSAEIAVEGADCGDVALFPIGSGAYGNRSVSCGCSCCELGRRRRRPDRMVVGQGDSPGCHSAAGVLLANLREGLAGLFVAEGVEQRHRSREGRLNPGFARDRKVNAPQRFARAVMRVLLLRARARYQSCAHADKCKSSSVSHWGSPRHLAPEAQADDMQVAAWDRLKVMTRQSGRSSMPSITRAQSVVEAERE